MVEALACGGGLWVLVLLYVAVLVGLGAGAGAACVAAGVRGGAVRLGVCVPVLALAAGLLGYSVLLISAMVSTPSAPYPGLTERLLAPYRRLGVDGAVVAALAPGIAGVAAGMGAAAGLRGPAWLLRMDLGEDEAAKALLCIAATRHPALTMAKLYLLRALLGPIPLLLYLNRLCRRR